MAQRKGISPLPTPMYLKYYSQSPELDRGGPGFPIPSPGLSPLDSAAGFGPQFPDKDNAASPVPEITASPAATDTSSQVQQKEWEPLDLTPYIRKTMPEPVLRNESIIQQQEMCKTEEINRFRELRELVLEQREKDQNARTLLKQNILEMYESLQASLDEARGRVLSARETYRSKLLEAELKKQEALAAEEAAIRAEQEKKSPDAQKKKQGKSAGKKK